MAYIDSAEMIESLAADIGDNVYIDIAKWHLYLRDAKLHTTLAEQLYPMLSDGGVTEDALEQVLRGISVKLGGGRKTVTLADLLPVQCQVNLMDMLDDYHKKL